jgi:hypothetical protein
LGQMRLLTPSRMTPCKNGSARLVLVVLVVL